MTSVERVRCECGREYSVLGDDQRPSIRCHVCGQLIDLTPLKATVAQREAAAVEREAAARKLAQQAKVERAAQVNFAGVRFDGIYRTSSPVSFDGYCAAAMELSLRFNSDLVVEYSFRALDDENGVPTEIDNCSDQTRYDVANENAIQLAFDTGTWVCEWRGFVRADSLELSYCIEEYCGLSSGPKCVREGELRLTFEQSPD